MDMEPTTSGAINDTNTKVDVSRLGRIINNTDVKLNVGGLNIASKIAEKEVKIYKSNMF